MSGKFMQRVRQRRDWAEGREVVPVEDDDIGHGWPWGPWISGSFDKDHSQTGVCPADFPCYPMIFHDIWFGLAGLALICWLEFEMPRSFCSAIQDWPWRQDGDRMEMDMSMSKHQRRKNKRMLRVCQRISQRISGWWFGT